jgi:ATP-dependent Clp protease ATP-binding subunit ClpA
MKVSDDVQAVLSAAYQEAKNRQHEYLTPEHVLHAALNFDIIKEIIDECGADYEVISEDLEKYLSENIPVVKDTEPKQSVGFQRVIEHAVFQTESSQKGEVEITDILVATFEMENSFGAYFLKKAGVSKLDLLRVVSHADFLNEDLEETGDSSEDTEESGLIPLRKKRNVLKAFTTELTELAREGKLDPLIGREDILERTIQVLCRRLKNNPVFVGEPGVGKTAIAEGLAQRIADAEVPSFLEDSRIFSLDMGNLLAGTRFRGDFEERIKKVLRELQKLEKSILFIDEILLKPALAGGNLRCIGSTTFEDYKKHFDKDRALSRRFQKIEVPETTHEETLEILWGLKQRYEEYHGVTYSEHSLRSAVELSAKYINDRHLPDKAIDVIDEAGAYMRIMSYKDESDGGSPKAVTEKEIEKVVAKIARIPERSVSSSEIDRLKNLGVELKTVIFGQDKAIDSVVEAVKRSRAGFREEGKPVASFLFVGPTGVGKTELARQLAQILGIAIHRFDMSEYQEKHTVARLIGSPPGYVGYEEGGLLTDAIRKTPHAVLLLDEVEKAHQDVFNVLLQMMDYATVTDNTGRKADFRNVIIIMTSNAGARDIGKQIIGFAGGEITEQAITDAVEKIFSPEFRNRLDKVIHFNKLDESVVLRIVDKEVRTFSKQLEEKGVSLKVTPKCRKWLAGKGYSPEFGARNISRLVQDKIKSFFVDAVLFGSLSSGGNAVADVKEDDVVIRKNS